MVENYYICLINNGFLFQISVIILAIAVTIIAGDGTQTETHLNSQTEKQDTILEEESRKKDGKQVMKEEKQEINMHIENDEKICQHKRNVSECEEDYHDNEQLNKGIQLQEGKNMKTQHINKEQHLNVSIKPKYGEAEVSELHHGAKEGVKEGNDGELKERKRINEDSGPTQQVKKPFPLEEDTDEQAAQNNELENLQQGQHVDRLSEGYQVKETVHEEEHGVESRSGFNYLFSYHEDHTGHNLQPASKSFEDTSFGKRYVIQTSTLTDKDPAPHKFPVYIPEEKHVPYPVQKTAPYPIKQHVSHPVPVPVSATLHKQVPYTVYTPDPYPVKVPAARPYFVPVPAQKKVPFSVHVRVPVPQPYTVHVPKRYTVHVPKRYAVLLEKQVPATYPVRVEVPVSQPYPVNAKVPVPGKVPVDRPVLVPAEKTYPVTVQTDVHYPLQKPPYPVKVRSVGEQTYIRESEVEGRADNHCYNKMQSIAGE